MYLVSAPDLNKASMREGSSATQHPAPSSQAPHNSAHELSQPVEELVATFCRTTNFEQDTCINALLPGAQEVIHKQKYFLSRSQPWTAKASEAVPTPSHKDREWAGSTYWAVQVTELLTSILGAETGKERFFVDVSHIRDNSAGESKVRFLSQLPNSAAGLCTEPDPRVAEWLRNKVQACKKVFNGYPSDSDEM